MTRVIVIVLVLCACDSKKEQAPAASGGAPPKTAAGGPILTEEIVEAYIRVHEDASDNPLDRVCRLKECPTDFTDRSGCGKPGTTARYKTQRDGLAGANTWLKQRGFRDLSHFIDVTMRILNARGVVTMRESDPGYKPRDPIPEEDIALVAKHRVRIAAANQAQDARGAGSCE
jgi:hypothetical protein